jgi:fluoride exporter
MIDRRELGAIFLGGAVGTLVRAGMVEALAADAPDWPWATFLVNVTGAFLLGALLAWLPSTSYRRPLLMTGFCGALTTFSTVQVELLEMLDDGRIGFAAGYGLSSLLAGYFGVWLGGSIFRRERFQ